MSTTIAEHKAIKPIFANFIVIPLSAICINVIKICRLFKNVLRDYAYFDTDATIFIHIVFLLIRQFLRVLNQAIYLIHFR